MNSFNFNKNVFKWNNGKKNGNLKKMAIVSIVFFMVLSAVPIMAAEPTVNITFDFVDQYGDSISAVNERVYVDSHGWFEHGDSLTVDTNTVIYCRAYYQQNRFIEAGSRDS